MPVLTGEPCGVVLRSDLLSLRTRVRKLVIGGHRLRLRPKHGGSEKPTDEAERGADLPK